MPRCNRSGQAAILSPEQLDALMEHLDPLGRAVFQTARFTAGRINEVEGATSTPSPAKHTKHSDMFGLYAHTCPDPSLYCRRKFNNAC